MADPQTDPIIAAAIEVHRELGPGLLESIYEEALAHEFELRRIPAVRQKDVEVIYKGKRIKGQRVDFVAMQDVVVEIKSVRKLEEVFFAQVLGYLKATGMKKALLINFGEQRLVDGIRRISL